MATSHHFLAVDLGASNVRVVLGTLRGRELDLRCIHRFEHSPVRAGGRLRWHWRNIIEGVREGLAAAGRAVDPEPIQSVSCTGWAQDFGLLDARGRLTYPPVCYRDARTEGVLDVVAARIGLDELVRRTGSIALPITTLCQLVAMARDEPEVLGDAAALLNIADLVHHDLCGRATTDLTLASATQLRNIHSGCWDGELMRLLGIPERLLPPIADEPRRIGCVPDGTAPLASLGGVPVVTAAGHDTAAATVAMVPAAEDVLFLSIGTWAMVGCRVPAPELPGAAVKCRVALLGLPFGRWGLFRSEMGLWPLQECLRLWSTRGYAIDPRQLAVDAARADIASTVDLSDPRFQYPEDMPAEIARACAESGQRVPAEPGEFARVIVDSLVERIVDAAFELQELRGSPFARAQIVGGGSRNQYLSRRLAEILGKPIIVGPAEATAAGNILLQCVAGGYLEGSRETGEVARALTCEMGSPPEP